MADAIKTAKKIFDQFLSKADPASMPDYDPNAKDPQKQSAGREGGKVGGLARAKALSPQKRKGIAKKGAKARWTVHPH